MFEIGGRKVTRDGRAFVIAEIGNNHNGSVKLCKALIKRAKDNGADAVKLQKRSPKDLFTKAMYDKPYTSDNSFGPTYGKHREALEFSHGEWFQLKDYAEKVGIMLFSTAFDEESVNFLESIDLPAYKVASGCLRDIPLIKTIANTGKPMIVSTGGGTLDDIYRVFDVLSNLCGNFCFLHCVASYPNRAADMNLNIIKTMLDKFPVVIGLSDHYQGKLMATAAFAIGARVFEKHFTSDHTLPGPDHALSLEPHELNELSHDLERLHAAMGDGEKRFLECEKPGIYKMGKAIHVARDIPKGKKVEHADICIKSPEEGIMPYEIDDLIGRATLRALSTDDTLTWDDILYYGG